MVARDDPASVLLVDQPVTGSSECRLPCREPRRLGLWKCSALPRMLWALIARHSLLGVSPVNQDAV